MIDRKFIGLTSGPRVVDVEKGQVAFFARTIGETDPIYFDEEAARAKGYRTIPSPPTFGFSLKLFAPAEELDWSVLGVNIEKILHGEETFFYHAPIYVGDRVTLNTKISDIYDKKGGALEFVVQDTTAVNQHGTLVLESQTVAIVRNS